MIGHEISESNKSQAIIPSNGKVFPNSIGSARGLSFKKGNITLMALPGVPSEMESMMKETVLPWVRKNSKQTIFSINIRTTGVPESMLFELTKDNHDSLEQKLYFKVTNKETQYGEVCGVHEFSAPPGVVYLPYHIMESCSLQEGNTVKVDLVSPPKGNFMKIRLHNSKEFSKLTNPKVVLEKIISRDYPVVTQGQTIALNYTDLNKVFMIDIVETRPSEIIEIIKDTKMKSNNIVDERFLCVVKKID